VISESLWAVLSPTARDKLRDQAQLLAQGFSGKIVLGCNRGGVRGMTLDIDSSEMVKLVQEA
jgi:hypothetical protein